jgi:hypothetical protein
LGAQSPLLLRVKAQGLRSLRELKLRSLKRPKKFDAKPARKHSVLLATFQIRRA